MENESLIGSIHRGFLRLLLPSQLQEAAGFQGEGARSHVCIYFALIGSYITPVPTERSESLASASSPTEKLSSVSPRGEKSLRK